MDIVSSESDLSEFLVLPSASTTNEVLVLASANSAPVIWSINQTKVLLDLYQKYRPKVGSGAIKNLKKLWDILAQELNKLLKTNMSPSHVENRWRVLERAYKKYVDNQNKTGEGKKYFEYAKEMDEIFKGKKNVKPVVLLSNESTEKMPQDEVSEENVTYPETPKASTSTLQTRSNLKRKKTPVINRNLTLSHMRQDRREYQEARLKIEREKLEVQQRKAKAMEERNILIKERNEFLKNKKYL